MTRFCCFQSSKNRFNRVVIARETLQPVHGFIESDDGSFGFGAHNLFGEQNAQFTKLRQHGIDAGAGFDDDDDGERVTANVEMNDFLRDAVVGDEKVLLVEVVDHGATLVADSSGSGNEGNAGGELGRDFWWSLLDWRVGLPCHGACGSLGKGGRGGKQESRGARKANLDGG